MDEKEHPKKFHFSKCIFEFMGITTGRPWGEKDDA
jgi:hypothetical protein